MTARSAIFASISTSLGVTRVPSPGVGAGAMPARFDEFADLVQGKPEPLRCLDHA